ncbi:DnaB-like helicase N-terminal domain-containing protein [Streptomyces sp. NPDC085665]|uniref:DnaB-like helicase N-terminal domain-containing protein n=1 Tax=Streptomyces sp. NPDC085665 TaxID=3365735 RepID=UPI0037CFB642
MCARVGRILVEPGTIPETAAAVLPEELSDPLAAVFTSILAVHAAREEPVNPLAVGIHLHRRGGLKEIGGSACLTALAEAGTPRAEAEKPAAFDSAWFAARIGAFPAGYAPDSTAR